MAGHRAAGRHRDRAAIVEFVNVSGKACVLKGHPSVAGAGNGSPEHNSPLAVTPTGSASPVKLAPGARRGRS
ncbi:DUF4232 domain-containing protein [Streptomyces sp. B21-106]|uniref:DUF4232 domain-containing protein n=1 Tax=Streptomyces sp. B21-106 TaxID=3039418 RepID=UPI002FEF24A2